MAVSLKTIKYIIFVGILLITGCSSPNQSASTDTVDNNMLTAMNVPISEADITLEPSCYANLENWRNGFNSWEQTRIEIAILEEVLPQLIEIEEQRIQNSTGLSHTIGCLAMGSAVGIPTRNIALFNRVTNVCLAYVNADKFVQDFQSNSAVLDLASAYNLDVSVIPSSAGNVTLSMTYQGAVTASMPFDIVVPGGSDRLIAQLEDAQRRSWEQYRVTADASNYFIETCDPNAGIIGMIGIDLFERVYGPVQYDVYLPPNVPLTNCNAIQQSDNPDDLNIDYAVDLFGTDGDDDAPIYYRTTLLTGRSVVTGLGAGELNTRDIPLRHNETTPRSNRIFGMRGDDNLNGDQYVVWGDTRYLEDLSNLDEIECQEDLHRDELHGGFGDDQLRGGIGNDILLGGFGDDTYYITLRYTEDGNGSVFREDTERYVSDGHDIIFDSDGIDTLVLLNVRISEVINAERQGSDLIITIANIQNPIGVTIHHAFREFNQIEYIKIGQNAPIPIHDFLLNLGFSEEDIRINAGGLIANTDQPSIDIDGFEILYGNDRDNEIEGSIIRPERMFIGEGNNRINADSYSRLVEDSQINNESYSDDTSPDFINLTTILNGYSEFSNTTDIIIGKNGNNFISPGFGNAEIYLGNGNNTIYLLDYRNFISNEVLPIQTEPEIINLSEQIRDLRTPILNMGHVIIQTGVGNNKLVLRHMIPESGDEFLFSAFDARWDGDHLFVSLPNSPDNLSWSIQYFNSDNWEFELRGSNDLRLSLTGSEFINLLGLIEP